MAYQGVLDDIRRCAAGQTPSRVPVFAISQEFDVRMAGVTHDAYGIDTDTMVKVHTQAVEQFDFDWVFHIPDDYVELETLGIKTEPGPRTPRAVVRYPPLTTETVGALTMPNFDELRMPAFLAALSRIKERFGDTICLTGNVAGPFGSVALTYGIDQAMILMIDQPELYFQAMDFFVDLQIAWGRKQREAGADAIWLGDCIATSGFISADHYAQFALERARKVANGLRDAGLLVFHHGGEIKLSHLEPMLQVGGDALSIGERTDLAPIAKALGDKACLMGNIDGIQALQNGDEQQVRDETQRIMEIGKTASGYIFNSGEGISYHAKEQNMHAMVQAAREFGRYP